jgi:transcriptional regulator with XRE-family HTH domain
MSQRPNRKSLTTANGRRTRAILRVALNDLDRARSDAGASLRTLATGSGVSEPYLSMVLAGRREPSVAVLTAVARALGGDLSIRFYPNTGPVIHDRIQSRIVAELLRIAAPTWTRLVEVPVYRPARGFIDVVLDSEPLATTVASEVEARIDRLEQQLRWAQEKAASLPSSEYWARTQGDRTVNRLLVLRTTRATLTIARRFDAILRAAYPASTAQVFSSLTTGIPWPGHGILWADVEGDAVRIRDRPPRNVDVGR